MPQFISGQTLEQVRRYDTSFSYNGELTDIVINVKKNKQKKTKRRTSVMKLFKKFFLFNYYVSHE